MTVLFGSYCKKLMHDEGTEDQRHDTDSKIDSDKGF